MALSLGGNDEAPIPQVYLACRLTHLTEDERQLLDSWCTHIEQAVTDASADSAARWNVSVHAPITWSAPWRGDNRSPKSIYALNSATVNACAAMIILSIDGGGLGVGQEFAWAVALRLPILLLYPADRPPSRQALGTPGDVTTIGFANAMELGEAVKAFLRANRPVIEDWQRRSDSLNVALLPLRETLAEHWHELGDAGQARVEAESRVHRRRIVQLIDDQYGIAGASMAEILALVGAMDIDGSSVFTTPAMPDLTGNQRDALALAADEYEWGGGEVLALETRARLELARGGTRRLSLTSPADWVQFRRQVDGRG
jgi:hypothetical protein